MATGIFGGTFDPIHIGHLRTALEIKSCLSLDRMVLIPCGDPPHRSSPQTPGEQRLEMARLAVSGEPGLSVDDRELLRPGLSYSIETLEEYRRELGSGEPLFFCIGMDSLVNFDRWHRWREFLTYCHIVVAARPGVALPEGGELADWIAEHRESESEQLLNQPAGGLFIDEMTLLPISATGLRRMLGDGESIRYLTTDAVIDYITQHRLYVQ